LVKVYRYSILLIYHQTYEKRNSGFRILVSAFLICSKFAVLSQNVDKKLLSIQGKWVLDDRKNVTIQREAPSLSKEEIYNRALNFFAYHYIDENIKIVNTDQSQGLVVARGVFVNLNNSFRGWHVIKIDVKDGKAKILLTLTEYQYPKISLQMESLILRLTQR
jgi:hypothetical protein